MAFAELLYQMMYYSNGYLIFLMALDTHEILPYRYIVYALWSLAVGGANTTKDIKIWLEILSGYLCLYHLSCWYDHQGILHKPRWHSCHYRWHILSWSLVNYSDSIFYWKYTLVKFSLVWWVPGDPIKHFSINCFNQDCRCINQGSHGSLFPGKVLSLKHGRPGPGKVLTFEYFR